MDPGFPDFAWAMFGVIRNTYISVINFKTKENMCNF